MSSQCSNCGLHFDMPLAHRTLGTVCPFCFHRHPQSRRRKRIGAMKRLAIAHRDGWQCHLCRGPVEPRATGHAAASIDHVIPLSAGGTNTLDNLKLAHAGCNSARGSAPVGSTQRTEARKAAQ